LDRTPRWDETFYVSGTGFTADVDIRITFDEPGTTSTFGGPGAPVTPSALHTGEDGSFGPWDVLYYEPTPAQFGDYAIEASDGQCVSRVEFRLRAP
jgi:hypothetical protein